ncbi:hypothetical protein [Halocatena halophila]|uniref:hypothetical protein n=1 Tax=Halocatena halophila TaxID=2814576 RepID=UPI002ED4D50A
MSVSAAFQQKREVVAGSIQAVAEGAEQDLHQDVKITCDKDGLQAEATIYNVARDTWKSVKKGDPFRISLGYLNGPYSVCILGSIQEKLPPEREGADVKYKIKGRDKSGAALRGTYQSHTWNKPTLDEIVHDIAGFAGLSPGIIDTSGGSIEQRWPMSKEHNLYHWLKELKKEADSQSGKQHEFHAESGKLHFTPKEQPSQQALRLEDGPKGNVIKLDEQQGKDKQSDDSGGLEFEALLDPRVKKNGLASIATENYSGTFRITEYELKSSTDTGKHRLSGKLASTGSKYRIVSGAPPHVPPNRPVNSSGF